MHNSVYRFRGADIRNILEFEEAFPDATTIVLDQNYRSTQTILDAANAVIDNNAGRKPKELWTDQGSGDKIIRYHAEDEGDEAAWVARTMHTMHETEGRRWGEMAVFYRTNAPEPGDRGSADAHRRARTTSSAAHASTTAARSRTRWPTCGPSSTRSTR